jgi:biopolymer transport protein ExbD
MRIRRQQRLTAVIPTASMADIAFLLIIFFMVTTAYSIDRTLVELPQTHEQQQVSKGRHLRHEGWRLSLLGRRRTPRGRRPQRWRAIRGVTAATLHPFVIKADRFVPYASSTRCSSSCGRPGPRT